jgi:CHAD domain-containing protein
MPTNAPNTELLILAEALGDLRDSWVLISMVLKDQITETPSLALEEAMLLVEKYLARINVTP